jgi:hypothetical protein
LHGGTQTANVNLNKNKNTEVPPTATQPTQGVQSPPAPSEEPQNTVKLKKPKTVKAKKPKNNINKAEASDLSTECPAVNHTLPIATRKQLLQRAARLRPAFLAQQKKRREATFIAEQKKEQQLQSYQLRRELGRLTVVEKTARDGTPRGAIQAMLWDFLTVLANTKITGKVDELLQLLTMVISKATGESTSSLPLTKHIDIMLTLAGLTKQLSDEHESLPNF